jgi:transcriptional regulator with XRE-family HTH domain
MMSSGEIVRQIRLTKGLKTKNLYRGLMAQPTSSQYERGKKEIKISKLLIIIARLNLDLEEFVYLFERENDEFALYEKYHQRLLKAFKNKALMEVCLIHQNISNLTESNRLSRFNNLGLLASCMLKKLEAKSESFACGKRINYRILNGGEGLE